MQHIILKARDNLWHGIKMHGTIKIDIYCKIKHIGGKVRLPTYIPVFMPVSVELKMKYINAASHVINHRSENQCYRHELIQ